MNKNSIIIESLGKSDYFNLIKTNEGWFIVDKIAVRKAK